MFGGNPELVALCEAKKDQLKRVRSMIHIVAGIPLLRPLPRRNYCQAKTRGNNSPFSEESYAGKVCLDEAGITNETQSESLYGEGQSHVSSFNDDSLKIREDGCTSPRDEGTSSSAEIDADDICKNVNSAMHQHAIDSYSRDSYSDDVNQHSPLQNKPSEASSEKMCQVCGKVFTDSHKLTVHLKEAHKNMNADNVCPICDKKLRSSSSLRRHHLVHSGEKPHKCDICGQKFTTSGNRNRHMRRHEKRKISTSSSEGESKMKKRKIARGNKSKSPVSVSDSEVKTAEVHERESKVRKQSIHGNNSKTPVFVSEDKEKKAEGQKCENNVQKQKSDHGSTKTSVSENELEKDPECKKINCTSGFKDLTMISFSSPKFPLMARIECEKHRRCPLFKNTDEVTSLSNTMNVRKMCRKCDVCFPCTRSLDLHMKAHDHENSLICNVCGAAFPSSNEYNFHMVRYSHDGKRSLGSTSYFLNQLGLQRVPHATNEESEHSQTEIFEQNECEIINKTDQKEHLTLHFKTDVEKKQAMPENSNKSDDAELMESSTEANDCVASSDSSTPVSQNAAEGCSSLYPETIVNLQINPNDEAEALEALMLELSETNQISDDQPLDLSVRPLDLSLNKSVVQHHNNTGVSQRLSDTSEQIANVHEPPPAHTSAFTPKIINFNTTINSNAIDLSQSRIASPTPFFPTQYSIPNHNNTGVSQGLIYTSEPIANVPEPPPAHTSEINENLKDACLRDEHTPKLHSSGDYAAESNMKKDSQYSHEKIKRYACKICKKTFSTSNSRDRHANIHIRKVDFACSECNKKFSTKYNLERHKNKSCPKLKNDQNSFSDQIELSENVNQSLNLSGISKNDYLRSSMGEIIHPEDTLLSSKRNGNTSLKIQTSISRVFNLRKKRY